MPTEERYIKFTFDEIHKALSIYAIEAESQKIPDGIIKHIQLSEEEEGYIDVNIQKNEHEKANISLKQSFFVMALVFSCQAHNIPLPRNAKKILSFRDRAVVLKIGFQQKTIQKVEDDGSENDEGPEGPEEEYTATNEQDLASASPVHVEPPPPVQQPPANTQAAPQQPPPQPAAAQQGEESPPIELPDASSSSQ